jgi:hypothetical protein
MKCARRGILASCLVAAVLWGSGCKHEPNPPTEQDAIAVCKNIQRGESELISLKKTNGQMATVNPDGDRQRCKDLHTVLHSLEEDFSEGWDPSPRMD